MSKFIKNEDGIWDAPNCHECCCDCNHPEEECECPRVFLDKEDCNDCIFKNGYKKCRECCTNPQTDKEEYIRLGFWWMCNECVEKLLQKYEV